MKAVLSTRYGSPDVLELREVPRPAPGPGEILIEVHATTVSRTDCGALRGYPRFARVVTGVFKPKATILGMDFAGVVAETGANVTRFAPGDRVFGLSPDTFGAHAEFFCLPEAGPVETMPEGLPFGEAVLCEGAWYAGMYLDRFGLGPGDAILIYGASGAIGTAAVQLARARGAEVTAVAEGRHLELVTSLGAARAIDYQSEDFTAIDTRFDYILDAVGKASYFRCRKLLKPSGVYAASDLGQRYEMPLLALWSWITGNGRVLFPTPQDAGPAVAEAASLLEAGELRAVIDRRYPLDEIVEAYRYVETATKTGIVVIDVVGEAG